MGIWHIFPLEKLPPPGPKTPFHSDLKSINHTYSDNFGRDLPDHPWRVRCTSRVPLRLACSQSAKSLQCTLSPQLHPPAPPSQPLPGKQLFRAHGAGAQPGSHLSRLCQHLCSGSAGGSWWVTSFSWQVWSLTSQGQWNNKQTHRYIYVYWK